VCAEDETTNGGENVIGILSSVVLASVVAAVAGTIAGYIIAHFDG